MLHGAVRPDGSSQDGLLVFATTTQLEKGHEAPISIMDWRSWKLTRKVRSSLAAESQAAADAVDSLNFVRLVFAECLSADGIDLRKIDEIHQLSPPALLITDCKSLYDALEKNESITLGLAEKRTSIEVQATKQQLRSTLITTKWVNSDRQIADVLTKVNTNPHDLIALMKTGHWKIVWDKNFVSAKNIRKQNRAKFFKNTTRHSNSPSTSTRTTTPFQTMWS